MSPQPREPRGWRMSILLIRLGVSQTFKQMVVSCERESRSVKPIFINHGLLVLDKLGDLEPAGVIT